MTVDRLLIHRRLIHHRDGTVRRLFPLVWTFFITLPLILISPPLSTAQTDSPVELHVEALAGGVTVTFPTGSEWSVGIDLSAGNHLGVDLLEGDEDVDIIGAGYPVVTWRPDPHWQLSLGPIGFGAVLGKDFAAFYPSARLGAGYFFGDIGVGTEFRLVRIAGGHGTGEYWLHWSPVRVSLRL